MTHESPYITVLTTTFNRAHTLSQLHKSLFNQEFRDFEWLLIDDGSTDGTRELVKTWISNSTFFTIRYYWFENKGKHVALNRGVERAKGKFCAVIDSDDFYPESALKDLIDAWCGIPLQERANFANVEGLGATKQGEIIGSKFPEDVYDSDNYSIRLEREKLGDTQGMYRTDILKKYPFPEQFPFIRESIVWNRIAERYHTRFINKVIGIKEYLEGGLSNISLREKINKRGDSTIFYYTQLLSMQLPLTKKMKRNAVFNIILMSLHRRRNFVKLFLDSNEKHLYLTMLPFAIAKYLRQKIKLFHSEHLE